MSVRSVRVSMRSQLRESVSTAILESAEDLIASKGLQSAPLAQIAKRAGVAVGTLYNYFEDREALIAALFELRRGTLRTQLRAALAAGRSLPFEPRLRAFVRDVFAIMQVHRKFVKVAIEAEHIRLVPSGSSQDLSRALEELVAVGVAEKQLAANSTELMSIVLAGAIRAVLLRRITDETPLHADDGEQIVSLFLEGARR